MKTEKTITLEQAKVGELLVKDVCDAQGNCLLAAGVVLNEAQLAQLHARNIEYLVVCHELDYCEDEIIKQQALVKEKLAQRFRHVKDNPDMCHLHDLLLAYRTETFSETTEQGEKKDEC